MPPKSLNLISREEAERRLKAEEAEAEAKAKAGHTGDPRTAPGPDLSYAACCDCGAFGSWGDGQFRYCKYHVPHSLRYLAKTREEEARRTK